MDAVTNLAARELQSRQNNCYITTFGRQRCYGNNRWTGWGRWVLLGVILLVALVAFFLCACMSARRRRSVNRKPFAGTGWAVPAGMKYTGTQNKPSQMEQGYQAPPPQYGAQGNTTSGGGNAEYYGSGNQYGNNSQYQPPVGAPPAQYENQQYGQYQAPSGPPPAHVR